VTAALVLALLSQCGSERVAVKNLADGFEPPAHAEPATVTELAKLPMPKWSNSAPRSEVERRVMQLEADVIGYKLESDSDFHVVVSDGKQTMVVEFPSPRCAKDARLAKARADFLALVPRPPTPAYRTLPKPIRVRLTGVVFLDKHLPGHIPTGSAPNGVELHPVLSIFEP
jgi:hypothetical protein